MNIFVFILAATLSLPKQFIIVYIGVIVEEAGDGEYQFFARLSHLLNSCNIR